MDAPAKFRHRLSRPSRCRVKCLMRRPADVPADFHRAREARGRSECGSSAQPVGRVSAGTALGKSPGESAGTSRAGQLQGNRPAPFTEKISSLAASS